LIKRLKDILSLFPLKETNMKIKQLVLLLVVFVLPVAIFLFLKGFGKNEFAVPPLFAEAIPEESRGCGDHVVVPYHISPGQLGDLSITIDSLACVSFDTEERLARVKEAYANTPLKFYPLRKSEHAEKMKCIFLLTEPFDIALVDNKGRIRGQYNSSRRDEIDRLITEIAIIFRKY
jgi:hypothetical protein